MSTWKSNKIEVRLDAHDDYIKAEAGWEYQTTADVFTYFETVTDRNCSSWTKNGEHFTHITVGPDSAKYLYHALSNWMKTYYMDSQYKEVIDDNLFSKALLIKADKQ